MISVSGGWTHSLPLLSCFVWQTSYYTSFQDAALLVPTNTDICLSRQTESAQFSHKRYFERTSEEAAFVISNLSRMERRGLHYILRLNKDRASTLVASLKHEHAKYMALHFHSLPSSVSHMPVSLSLCILLYRDWAVGRRLQSLLLRITANWRC